MRRALSLAVAVVALAAFGGSAVAEGDPAAGEKVFKKCAQCHEVGEGAKNKIGPELNDVYGRKAGGLDDFNYSPAMKQAGEEGWVWDTEHLDKYLADPNYMSLGAKAANSNAARLYIDYACSPEGQKHIAEDGEFVLAPGVLPPIKDADKVQPNIVLMDNPSAEEFKKLMTGTLRDIFYAK